MQQTISAFQRRPEKVTEQAKQPNPYDEQGFIIGCSLDRVSCRAFFIRQTLLFQALILPRQSS